MVVIKKERDSVREKYQNEQADPKGFTPSRSAMGKASKTVCNDTLLCEQGNRGQKAKFIKKESDRIRAEAWF